MNKRAIEWKAVTNQDIGLENVSKTTDFVSSGM